MPHPTPPNTPEPTTPGPAASGPAGRLRRWTVAGSGTAGALAAGVPGTVAAYRGDLVLALVLIGASVLIAVLTAVTTMYLAWQETNRLEITLRPANTVADAFAACVAASHVGAHCADKTLPETEAAHVRNSARKVLSDVLAPHLNEILAATSNAPGAAPGDNRPSSQTAEGPSEGESSANSTASAWGSPDRRIYTARCLQLDRSIRVSRRFLS